MIERESILADVICAPHSRAAVIAPGKTAALVVAKHRAIDGTIVRELAFLLAGVRVPQPCRAVVTPGQNAALVVAKHRAIDGTIVRELAFLLAGVRVPQPRRSAVTP